MAEETIGYMIKNEKKLKIVNLRIEQESCKENTIDNLPKPLHNWVKKEFARHIRLFSLHQEYHLPHLHNQDSFTCYIKSNNHGNDVKLEVVYSYFPIKNDKIGIIIDKASYKKTNLSC